jgi:hypothetical protein
MEIHSVVLGLYHADELSKLRSARQGFERAEDWSVRSDQIPSKEQRII